MFGGSKKSPAEQANMNLKARQLATNEQARPLTVFAGTQRVGSTHIVEPFGQRSISSKSGTWYLASWAVMFCRGPIDVFYKEIWDDEVINEETITRVAAPNSATWAGPRYNRKLYMGSTTQAQDTVLATNGNHPPYRNCVYERMSDTLIGVNRQTLPNIELVVGRWPKPAWWTADVDGDGFPKIGPDINPVAFVAEVLQDPIFGLGLADARLDTDSFNDAAAELASEGVGISPIVSRRMGLRDILKGVFEIIDGHLFALANGKIGFNLIRSPGGGLTLLDESKWIGGVDLDPDGWAETVNALAVAFSDAELDYYTNTAQFIDRGNYAITNVNRTQTVQRPWITSQALAQKVALATGTRLAMPQMRGSLRARKSVAKDLLPGTAFQLTCAELGLAAVTCRVLEQTLPKPKGEPEVALKWELDRSYLNGEFYAPQMDPPTAGGAGGGAAVAVKLMEWPWMFGHTQPMLLALVARSAGSATGFLAHMRKPSGSYEQIGFSQNFAMHGEVVDEDYPEATDPIDATVGMVVQLDSFDNEVESLSEDDVELDDLLVVCGDEIASAFGATLLAAGKYRIFLARGRYDTIAEAHAQGEEVWIFRRREGAFFPAANEIETQTWKFQQATLDGDVEDLGLVTAAALTTTGRYWRPLEPSGLAAFGNGVNPTYAPGEDVPLTWDLRVERAGKHWTALETGWTEALPDTILEFWTVGGGAALMHTVEIAVAPFGSFIEAIDNYGVANADLVAWLGGEVTFQVRAYARRDGYRSTRYASLTVTKV